MSRISRGHDPPGELRIDDAVNLLNSIFKTAKVDAMIVEFSIAREEIVIGFPEQVERFENELTNIKSTEDLKQSGRYIALVRLISKQREVFSIVRFYKKKDGSLRIEDVHDEEITLIEEAELDKPGRWKPVGEFARDIAEIIVRVVVEKLVRQL